MFSILPTRSSVLHDFHVDTASTSESKAVSTFNFLFSANNDADEDDGDGDDDSGVCHLLANEERLDGAGSSASSREAVESPTSSTASSSSKKKQQRRRDTRERFISNSVYGVEEVDHGLIAELLEEDNRHLAT